MNSKITKDSVLTLIRSTADGLITSAAAASSLGVTVQTASRFLSGLVEEGTLFVCGSVVTGKRGRPASKFAIVGTSPVLPVVAPAPLDQTPSVSANSSPDTTTVTASVAVLGPTESVEVTV